MDFEGAKVALFLGQKLAVIQRDDFVGLPFAGFWDLPGGGRESSETPFECVARECKEELGLRLAPSDVVWSRRFVSTTTGIGTAWYFVAHLPEAAVGRVVFGDEGQRWALITPDAFLAHPKAVPAFQERLQLYLAENK